MITRLFFLLLFVCTFGYASAQYCTDDNRFSNVPYFSISEIDSVFNVTYAIADDWQGNSEVLRMDIYHPANDIDNMTSRPFVLFIHGGGFVGGARSGYRYECREFAKRGYVAATMSYRLGFGNPEDIAEAIYRAQQDANAALRFVVDNSEEYGIDAEWLFIGGGSAGAITSLFTAYADEEEWEVDNPGIVGELGSLFTSGNDLTSVFEIKGINNHAGGAFTSATEQEELIPTISYHGQQDDIVPIGVAANGLSGSQALYDLHSSGGVCFDLTIDPQAGHEAFFSNNDRLFVVNRSSCFFKSILCEECSTYYSTEMEEADCSETSTAIDEFSALNEIRVYPTVFTHSLTIEGSQPYDMYFLYDGLGRLQFQGQNIYDFNLEGLQSGPYLLRVERKGQSRAFMLQRY